MTRRQRYLLRRDRYLRRARAARSRGWTWGLVLAQDGVRMVKGRIARPYRATPVGVCLPARVSGKAFAATPDKVFNYFPTVTFVVSEVGHAKPPHVTLTGDAAATVAAYHGNFPYVMIGYHRRRVPVWGRKPTRHDGAWRKRWGAAVFVTYNGFFPDWDPLHRHPTESEVEAGAPLYSGPFPQS